MPRCGSGQQFSAKHQYAHLRVTQDTYRGFGRTPVDTRILQMLSETGAPRHHAGDWNVQPLQPLCQVYKEDPTVADGTVGVLRVKPFFRSIPCCFLSGVLQADQTVRARIEADAGNRGEVACRLYIRTYDVHKLIRAHDTNAVLDPRASQELVWRIAENHGAPIAEIGLEIAGPQEASGTIDLDYLTWDGAPIDLTDPGISPRMQSQRDPARNGAS